MAAGYTSPAVWLGASAAKAAGGYITLPWWQAGGGIGSDPEPEQLTKGGFSKAEREKQKELQEQFELEKKALFDKIFGTEETIVEITRDNIPDGYSLNDSTSPVFKVPPLPSPELIKKEIRQQVRRLVDKYEEHQLNSVRQQLMTAARKELKLREEEEELLLLLILEHG